MFIKTCFLAEQVFSFLLVSKKDEKPGIDKFDSNH
jgi:hypothetical protein